MKTSKQLIAVVIALFALASTASAQISFGAKVGAKINDLRFKPDHIEDTYNPGFTCGLMLEYMFPKTNVGIDVSLMYFNVKTKFNEYINTPKVQEIEYPTHFIELPVNFKWKVIRKPVTPFLTTGPSLSVIGGERQLVSNHLRCKAAVIDWNFGLGAEILNKVQVGVNYGLGLIDAFEIKGGLKGTWIDLDGKRNSWPISATYMF